MVRLASVIVNPDALIDALRPSEPDRVVAVPHLAHATCGAGGLQCRVVGAASATSRRRSVSSVANRQLPEPAHRRWVERVRSQAPQNASDTDAMIASPDAILTSHSARVPLRGDICLLSRTPPRRVADGRSRYIGAACRRRAASDVMLTIPVAETEPRQVDRVAGQWRDQARRWLTVPTWSQRLEPSRYYH